MQNTNIASSSSSSSSSMVIDHELTVIIGDAVARVDCKIHRDNAAHAHFFYAGKDHNFALTLWKAKSFAKFRSLFHRVYVDIDKFGSSEVDVNTGDVVSSTNTADQNRNVVKQAIDDIFHLLHVILKEYPKEILDYAVWFCDKYAANLETNYSTYIHVMTCHCIVHGDFIAGHIARKVVYCPFG
jgi:hypothetical protein